MGKFKKVESNKKFPEMEKEVANFWKENDTFKKSLENRKDSKEYTFYDGPPFATGTPHYGHIVANILKDVVPRYWTMRGFHVERKWGWDCHGLPIENIVEKEMGSKKKKDIEAMGVEKFNELCRSKVLTYVDEWEKVIGRLGRWADMKNAYRTMDKDYMESVWWVFKELWDKGLIYEDYRSMHICPRCETTLSQQEVSEGYKDIKDLSVIGKFELVDEPGTFVLAWTTTPWTLPGNVALAVGEDIDYVKIKKKDEGDGELVRFILAKDRLSEIFKDDKYKIVEEFKGKDLVGKKYKPLFDFYLDKNEKLLKEKNESSDEMKVVVCAVINKKGEILLGHRLYSKDTPKVGKDFWIAPGGKIEDGETLEDAIKRELSEECNLENYEIVKYLGSAPGYLKNQKLFYYLLEVEDFDQLKNSEPEKFEEWKFFPIDKIPVDELPNKEQDKKILEEAFKWNNVYKIYAGDFVTTDEGTGVVHIAPAFGEDDMRLGKENNLPFIQHVAMDGSFKEETGELAGLNVKPIDNHQATDIEIIKYLAKQGTLFSKEKYEHSYPHCWRCDTPLINYATSSWFVKVTDVKERALDLAKNINWSPAHMKEGRFGKWLEGARDWSISRQRFWASVMPIWVCDKCGEKKVVGSIDEIREGFGNPNKLFLVRHGEAQSNVKGFFSSMPEKKENPLTQNGREQIEEAAKVLADEKVDLILTSPLQRTQETAEILAKKLKVEVITEELLRETKSGKLNGEKFDLRMVQKEQLVGNNSNGVETLEQVKERMQKFVDKINTEYKGKNIVVVSHGDPLRMLKGVLNGNSVKEIFAKRYPKNGEVIREYSKSIDLHKHIVDRITFKCEKCDGGMKRVSDVLDTWFDSGSMPYAQKHYPFENKKEFDKSFPADFIAEGVDQTRAWFYYLHVIGASIKNSEAFKNVIVNGIVLAEDGKKMSKKLQNYPDPMEMLEKYGADSVRYYLMSSPVVAAQNLSFKENDVSEITRGMMRMLWNSYSFFVLYADIDKFKPEENFQPEKLNALLDKWLVSELHMLIKEFNLHMENYELHKAARLLPKFIDNLSNWYIRRSRKRFWKSENDGDKNEAYQTLYYVLVELSKVMAPFTPFISEEIFRNLTKNESVHLEDFPVANEKLIDEKVNSEMEMVREIVNIGLQLRAKNGIKVRQPLGELEILKCELDEELLDIIKEEVNVKNVASVGDVEESENTVWDEEKKVGLNIEISEDLKLEGQAREVIRHIQQMRKEAGYEVDNRIDIWYTGKNPVFEKFGDLIAKETLAKEVHLKSNNEEINADLEKEIRVDEDKFVISIKK